MVRGAHSAACSSASCSPLHKVARITATQAHSADAADAAIVRSAAAAAAGLLTSGQLGAALAFLSRHPDALASILILSCAATAGAVSGRLCVCVCVARLSLGCRSMQEWRLACSALSLFQALAQLLPLCTPPAKVRVRPPCPD